MREVLQDDGCPDHGGRLLHDLLRPCAFQAQHREGLVDVPGAFHPLQLFGDDHPVHDFRDLHEPHPLFHNDHGQGCAQRDLTQRFHAALPVSDEFHNQAGSCRLLQGPDERRREAGFLFQLESGREHQLPS